MTRRARPKLERTQAAQTPADRAHADQTPIVQTGDGRSDDAARLRRRRQWLVVSYDIEDDRRRDRVMKAIAGYGERAQYSVFECEVRPADVDALEARLREMLDGRVDDVRFYLLCERCLGKMRLLGKAERYRRRAFVIV